MTKPFDHMAFEAELARLRDLDLPELRQVWAVHHGGPAPKTIRRNILILSIAWQIQAKALDGLSAATRRILQQVADSVASGGPIVRPPPVRRIKPGTRLIRSWHDTTHVVTALPQGFEWQGRTYRSLSEIARAITGTRWNGPVFFGVRALGPKKASGRKTPPARPPGRRGVSKAAEGPHV